MAEAVVSVFTEQLVSTIRLELEQKVTLVVDVRKEVESLSTTFRSIQAVLQDAEKQQVTSAAVKLWLEELKNLAYNADDVLDEWKTRILISQLQTATLANRVLSYLSSPCSCFYPVVVRYDIAHRIKLIRERLDEVARDKDQFKLKENHSPQERPPRLRLLTSSIADVSKIYGRELDKQIILSRLLGEGSQEEIHAPVPIISIVGTGGFGKTTLAQLVFKEETVVNTFELKMWICVSEPFERERLAKEIIQQAGGNANNVVGWEDLHQALCASVKGKQFLLVLDDVWSEDPEDWNPLQLSLDGGAPGSRIIVTTRSENVATMVGSTCTHRLGQLSEDHCWSLFQQIAFLGRSLEERGKLEEIGIEITKKCKGVPLAVKTIAGLMRSKPTKQDWRNVLTSDTWRADHLEKGFLPALLLSYHALPSNVKLCFTYCATYSKDTIMVKDELVKLWMAQGYLDSDGGEDLEMIGGEYFNDLAMRSFFQVFEKDSSGSIVRCMMHDLVHDLAQFLMKSECLFCQDTDKEININCSKVRHMTCSFGSENHSMIYKFKNLRTLVLQKSWEPTEVLRAPQLHQLTCLRALDLSHLGLGELPGGLEGLLHLRYLDLSYNLDIVKLPRNICNLYNLQTLKLVFCTNIRRLPEEIGSLVNLRHLEMEVTPGLKYIPASIGRLSQLRTLSKFIVSGNNTGGCAFGELGNMNYLSGHLSILALRHVRDANEAKSAELQKKTNINSLELQFGGSDKETEEAEEIQRMESVLEGIEPHNYLETLRIYDYPGLAFPRWMSSEASSSLSNIVKLQLERCNRCTILPTGLGKLRYLEELVICSKSVKQLGPDFCGGAGVAAGASDEEDTTDFPKLKRLELEMEELEDWVMIPTSSKFKNKFMPCLRELHLSKLKRLPALGRLGSLEMISIYDLRSLEAIRIEDLASLESVGADKDSNSGIILPRLREVSIGNCPKLKTLPALMQLKSLERLSLYGLDAVKHVRSELFGVSNSDGTNGELSAATVVVFPSLNNLKLRDFKEWGAENEETTTGNVSMFPSLDDLQIEGCRKLKVVPYYLFPHTLRSLWIQDCPQLAGVQQHCLPLLLESLILSGDVGVLSRSLLPIFTHNSNYPNLKSFQIYNSRQSSLPQGLNQLTSLHSLRFGSCELLDFKPEEELRHFPMLQSLYIDNCPVLTKRCRRANWSISSLSNILEVYVNSKKIKSRN